MNDKQSYVVPDIETGLRRVRDEQVAFVEDHTSLMLDLQNDTETELLVNEFAEPLSFITRRNFPYYHLFKRE